MANMVVATDDEPQTAQVLGECSIAGEIFAHAVGDLHNAAYLHLLGHQDVIGDIGYTVGAFINILCALDIHKNTPRSGKQILLQISYHKIAAMWRFFEQN